MVQVLLKDALLSLSHRFQDDGLPIVISVDALSQQDLLRGGVLVELDGELLDAIEADWLQVAPIALVGNLVSQKRKTSGLAIGEDSLCGSAEHVSCV